LRNLGFPQYCRGSSLAKSSRGALISAEDASIKPDQYTNSTAGRIALADSKAAGKSEEFTSRSEDPASSEWNPMRVLSRSGSRPSILRLSTVKPVVGRDVMRGVEIPIFGG